LRNENIGQEWVGLPEAQRLSGLSQRVLRRLIGNGELRVTKIGRATRIDQHSLKRYMHHHDLAEQLRLFD
jgi:excisionase family DNA binding protein